VHSITLTQKIIVLVLTLNFSLRIDLKLNKGYKVISSVLFRTVRSNTYELITTRLRHSFYYMYRASTHT